MTDDIMALDERLARLEMTVATGFSELGARIDNVERGLRGEIDRQRREPPAGPDRGGPRRAPAVG